jgi:hypothetical protein
MNNATIGRCANRSSGKELWWDSQLFASQVLPFVDFSLKGWVWYQGENNMNSIKGNSMANIGYGCMMRELINGWRSIWSETPGTTDPLAPFGIVTLASSGSEGNPGMGIMRQAQTANYGIVPNTELPNTFLAQAYDLDDEWGPTAGPCFHAWSCCDYKDSQYNATTCNVTLKEKCKNACAAADGTTSFMGGIHPRSKKHVGDRLGISAFNTVYKGTGAFTGPTLAGCTFGDDQLSLEIRFNENLLRGDKLVLQKMPPQFQLPGRHAPLAGGSQLYVQIESSDFCMEPLPRTDSQLHGSRYCPTWAGGDGRPTNASLDDGWIMLNFTIASKTSIKADLAPLHGAAPTAVRYAWGIIDCCDYSDPDMYVTHGCIESCPIMSSSYLPANPFQAKIVSGECQCIAPQFCSEPQMPTDG